MNLTPLQLERAAGRHLLALPAQVQPSDLALLAAARWRGTRSAEGTLALSRHSALSGPYGLTLSAQRLLALPAQVGQAWVAATLTERGEPPFPGAPDATGLARAFPEALPHREEGRVVNFLVAAARRLGGAVRFASGTVVCPQPDGALDLTVYSPIWLGPDHLAQTTRSVGPDLVLATGLQRRSVRPVPPPSSPVDTLLSAEERAKLHALLRQRDQALEAAGVVQEAYALESDLGQAGYVTIQVAVDAEPPRLIRELPWAARGVVAYAVRWLPANPGHLALEFPPEAHLTTRRAMVRQVAGLAKVIQAKIGTEVLDQDGFPVNPGDL